jgi:hypothetical protein
MLAPPEAAVLLATALPSARLALDPGEGHFFYRRRLREILGDLSAAAAPPARARPPRKAHSSSRARGARRGVLRNCR